MLILFNLEISRATSNIKWAPLWRTWEQPPTLVLILQIQSTQLRCRMPTLFGSNLRTVFVYLFVLFYLFFKKKKMGCVCFMCGVYVARVTYEYMWYRNVLCTCMCVCTRPCPCLSAKASRRHQMSCCITLCLIPLR